MMKTKKLYYVDPYISRFDATVLSVGREGESFIVVLDQTAFFPEEGGQTSDTGRIGEALVFYVKEIDGAVYHYTKSPVMEGQTYSCQIDFKDRYEKMKCHTAEHIICGLIHSRYGYENVGFHLGADIVTFDINAVLTRDMLDEIEDEANRVVSSCIAVSAYFPSKEELASISYRAKLELSDNVRLVLIGDIDTCACCAPHVSNTAEIGVIKILDFEKHRGGVRVTMQAGERALLDYRQKYTSVKRISELLSTPQNEVAESVWRLCQDNETLKSKIKEMSLRFARAEAERLMPCENNTVCYFSDFGMVELMEFSKLAVSKVGGILVALCGEDGDYKYVISSSNVDLRSILKDMNSALYGRGGGRAAMIQGSFNTSLDNIKRYFE